MTHGRAFLAAQKHHMKVIRIITFIGPLASKVPRCLSREELIAITAAEAPPVCVETT
jgi:hypothetical protein